MPAFPITPTTGDPVFRGISSSINSVRKFSRIASDSAVKLNSQERIVSPGEDSLSFAASRGLRSQLGGLRAVQESGQLNVTTLNLAIQGLEGIRGQLDGIKRLVVQAQAASSDDRDGLQAEIDLAIKQIDSTASSTKAGGRSLLDGSSAINAVQSIAFNGTVTQFDNFTNGTSISAETGIYNVRINKLGANFRSSTLVDGSKVARFSASITSIATKPALAVAGGAAGGYADFRITGKLGSATIRIASDSADPTDTPGAKAFNNLAEETGIQYTVADGFTTVGTGADDFIRVEYLGGSAANASGGLGSATIGTVGGAGQVGAAEVQNAVAAVASINGTSVALGGEWGTTARYTADGFDIEIDFTTQALYTAADYVFAARVDQGIGGLLGASARANDAVRYGINAATSGTLGKGAGVLLGHDVAGADDLANNDGKRAIGLASVGSLGTGGELALNSARLSDSIKVLDRAVSQVVKEQARLGSLQSNFIDAVSRAEVTQGNVNAADADILGVDAAAEITNLVQAQVGVSTATALSSQMTNIQQTVLSLLRA